MTPILYSFRRCPYAMRARMAIQFSGLNVELREILLKDKPENMLEISPDATVPLLVLPDGKVIDESWQIMLWALQQKDKNKDGGWLGQDGSLVFEAEMLLEMNDFSFKEDLDHYKYADRYPEQPVEYYRSSAEAFLQDLEEMLDENAFLLGEQVSIADIAIFPFIRQFAAVDYEWFQSTNYPLLQLWLAKMVDSDIFLRVMKKSPVWQPGDTAIYFPF